MSGSTPTSRLLAARAAYNAATVLLAIALAGAAVEVGAERSARAATSSETARDAGPMTRIVRAMRVLVDVSTRPARLERPWAVGDAWTASVSCAAGVVAFEGASASWLARAGLLDLPPPVA